MCVCVYVCTCVYVCVYMCVRTFNNYSNTPFATSLYVLRILIRALPVFLSLFHSFPIIIRKLDSD